MLVFSLIFYQSPCITFPHPNTCPLPQLVVIPSKLGPIYNCILIYEWFFNQFHTITYSFKPTATPLLNKKVSIRPSLFHPLSLHHVLFFIYILINFISVYCIHAYNLPLSLLSAIPILLFSSTIIYCRPVTSFHPPFLSVPTLLPPITDVSTNHQKMLLKCLAIHGCTQLTSHEIFRQSRHLH
jgi:hypothetical protein